LCASEEAAKLVVNILSLFHRVRCAGAGGCCWSSVREKHYWLVAGGCCWNGVGGKYYWLVPEQNSTTG